MMEYQDIIPDVLKRFPRVGLLSTSTPIYKLEKISASFGHNIFVIRDDLTGFGLGGNKPRKLEYLIGDAIAKKADTLVTQKTSNFSRNAAVAQRMCGCDLHIVILGDESELNPNSRMFLSQFSINLHYVGQSSETAIHDSYSNLLETLNKQDKTVYELHPGGSTPIGALGYINAFQQILLYSKDSGIHFHKIIHSTGSSGTQAGLLLGQSISGYETDIIGMAAGNNAEVQSDDILELTLSTARMLGIEFNKKLIHVDDRFIGAGYAIPSEKGEKAMKTFAEREGILLDHVYTGKAAAGLLHYAMNNMFDKGDNILFIHTGGNGGIFY